MISIALATTVLASDSDVQTRYSITIARTQERLFPNPNVLGSECGTAKRIYACTVFAEERLSCSCRHDGNGWRLVANARFVPIMCLYLRHPRIVGHEQLHINDVRRMLDEYLDELTSRDLATEEGCAQLAKQESEERAFVRRMNGFRQKSNERLH